MSVTFLNPTKLCISRTFLKICIVFVEYTFQWIVNRTVGEWMLMLSANTTVESLKQ